MTKAMKTSKLYILLKIRNLSDLNDLHNAQVVIILLEMMENRFQSMQEKSGYNPRIIKLASKLSGCIKREQTKSILAFLVNNTQVEVFVKTLCGGFSCVYTRFSFNTEILMPYLIERDYLNMSINQSFKAFKCDDLKVIYSLKLDKNYSFEKKRVITKIVKFDKNNQYSFAITKPMLTGCNKEYNLPSWLTFNLLLEKVSLDDPIEQFFVVDIEFDQKNTTKK